MRAGRRMAPMYGLVDVDVTEVNRILARHDPPWSLTAFVPATGVDWTAVGWLTGLAVICALAGLAAFRRRDLAAA